MRCKHITLKTVNIGHTNFLTNSHDSKLWATFTQVWFIISLKETCIISLAEKVEYLLPFNAIYYAAYIK